MRLETLDIALVATYYGLLIVSGSIMWAVIMQANDDAPSVTLLSAVEIAMSAALAVSSLFYVRKLYKDTFAALTPGYDKQNTSRIATVIYYVARPIFACAISVLTAVFLFEFVHAMSVGHVGVSFNFLLFSTVSSALVAIGTGVAVERIETVAKHSDAVLRPPI